MLNRESLFIGSVPEFYERYLVPMHFEAHARIMVERLGQLRSGHLLEIAAGTGAVTRLLARELPDTVTITATDLNEPMLEIARAQPGTERAKPGVIGDSSQVPSLMPPSLLRISVDLWAVDRNRPIHNYPRHTDQPHSMRA